MKVERGKIEKWKSERRTWKSGKVKVETGEVEKWKSREVEHPKP